MVDTICLGQELCRRYEEEEPYKKGLVRAKARFHYLGFLWSPIIGRSDVDVNPVDF